MSVINVRAAIETALNSISPAIATAYENVAFVPVSGVPFQRLWLPDFLTENPTMGGTYYRIHTYAQVDLCYPLEVGTAAIAARAELIKAKFIRGASFVSGAITVNIESTPTLSGGIVEGDRYKVSMKFKYWADIFP